MGAVDFRLRLRPFMDLVFIESEPLDVVPLLSARKCDGRNGNIKYNKTKTYSAKRIEDSAVYEELTARWNELKERKDDQWYYSVGKSRPEREGTRSVRLQMKHIYRRVAQPLDKEHGYECGDNRDGLDRSKKCDE